MPDARPLTQRCKDDNWDLHQIAERNDGLALILKGKLDQERYVEILEQAWVGAVALDEAVDAAIIERPELGAVVLPEQRFAPYAAADLSYFGRDTADIEPRPGTTRFVEHVRAMSADPLYILGLHYVRLGACNGNRFVAMKARQHYGLTEGGLAFLDPFGEHQRHGWIAFKQALDGLELDDDEQDRVFAGVRAMYEYMINMANDDRHVPAAELLEQHGDSLDQDAFAKSHEVVTRKTAPAAGDVPLDLTEAN
ncbi:MAG: biliverdin-producing heme oxygenase [Phycisphaerales bacterium]